jgi:nitrite reductase/ring-hydroxylating ferredoxin subunit
MPSGEDQERFEDYLELQKYIEELQAGKVVHPPRNLTPEQARIYAMATRFYAASSEDATPRPDFVASLQRRLEQEVQQSEKKRLSFFKRSRPSKQVRVSRRALLTGGAVAAAASFGVGMGLDHLVAASNNTGVAHAEWPPLVPENVPSTWIPVATLDELDKSAKHFSTGTVEGYVIRNRIPSRYASAGQVIAMSAACTHMGCIVQWNKDDNKFHCPCHGGVFAQDGQVDNESASVQYLNALPRFDVRIDPDGNVFVRVPTASV